MGLCYIKEKFSVQVTVQNPAKYSNVARGMGGGGGGRESRRDLQGTSTFTHYSLTSETSILDLYPTLHSYSDITAPTPNSSDCTICDMDWSGGAAYRYSRIGSQKSA